MERNLIDFSTKELQELKKDKIYCLNGVIKMCRQMGNKDWKNNVIVKSYEDKIREIDTILSERGK